MKIINLFLVFICGISFPLNSQNISSSTQDEPEFLPEPIEFVYDMEAFLSKENSQKFRETATVYEMETGNEVILLIFKDIAEFEDLETFAYVMTAEMNPGKVEKMNGAAIVFCIELNDLVIVPMTGAKKALTEKFIYTLKEKKITPLLEKEQLFEAMHSSLVEIIKKWPKEKS
jgi:uncharacterized membrane protein YgcG